MKKLKYLFFSFGLLLVSTHGMSQCNSAFTYTVSSSDSAVYVFVDSAGTNWSYNHWGFSDGATYSGGGGALTHRFAYNDTFEVCHVVMDSARTCLDSSCQTVVVNSKSNSCVASFTFTVRGDTVDFTSTSTQATGYQWYLGDGTSRTAQSFSYIYSTGGGTSRTVNVCLIITDSVNNCSDSTCQAITISNKKCQANFMVTTYKDSAVFTNRSANTTGIAYSWDFGDGTSSNAFSPSHVYSTPGLYNACLTMYDSSTSCTSTYCDSLYIDTTSTGSCKANFTVTVNGLNASFNNTSTNATSYQWDFGDGNSSTAQYPGNTYSKPGTYTVCLIIGGTGTCTDTNCMTVTVDTNHCKASFRVAIDTSQKFKLYLINSSSNLSSHSYTWSFGDGTSSTSRNPNHQYSTFGRYLVCLTVSDTIYRCNQTHCDSIGMDSTGKLLKGGFILEVVEDDFSSIEEVISGSIAVYPNPSSKMLNMKLSTPANTVDIAVFGVDGKTVWVKEDWPTHESIFIGDLKNGLYLLRVSDGSTSWNARFVKQE